MIALRANLKNIQVMKISYTLPSLPEHPENRPWPTHEWPDIAHEVQADALPQNTLTGLLESAFGKDGQGVTGEMHALLVIQNGRILIEKYGPGKSAAHTYPSWSMAKSITHALVGIAVLDGKLNVDDPIPVPEWQTEGDPRKALSWDQLLRMSSGLSWVEEYEPGNPSDVIEMLFSGHHADFGRYAAEKDLTSPPDTQWYYSSGTTNIIARALQSVLGLSGEAMRDFMFDALFTPIGMTSAQPKFDPSGVFVGSSFCYCTARDFARFGYLYLRDGIWDGKRLLPEGWVDYARTPTPQPETEELGYGAHFWLNMCGPGSFSANGFQGQYTIMLPDLDMVIVRHGISEGEDGKIAVQSWLADLADSFR